MKTKVIKKYADVIAAVGINSIKGCSIRINSPVECHEFAKIVAASCYKYGAKRVSIVYSDIEFTKLQYKKEKLSSIEQIPDYLESRDKYFIDEKYFALNIIGDDPDAMKGVDPKKIQARTKALISKLYQYKKPYHTNELAWCIVACPTEKWAKKVFPECSKSQAVNKLWEVILKTVRVSEDNDAVAEWKKHNETLVANAKKLNEFNFKSLHYKASNGTDFTIELVPNHVWAGAACTSPSGHSFVPNMPTEEVFTMPYKLGANGTVIASKPLSRNGSLINNFQITFKDGAVVDFKAETGYDALKNIIETDENSKYLGEVALVPYHSPISLSNVVFLETLFDENAACHLALGDSFNENIINGENMSEEELIKAGANKSKNHVDFMIGTSDLSIVGLTHDGKEIPVFVNGDWAI